MGVPPHMQNGCRGDCLCWCYCFILN